MSLLFVGMAGGLTLYLIFTLYLLTGLVRLRSKPENPMHNKPNVSVVVAARNEETALPSLLDDLVNQDYPEHLVEFIIADDRSEDTTWSIIQSYAQKDSRITGVKITEVHPSMSPKKHALTKAIERSNGEIIVATDADCRVNRGWVQSMVNSLGSEKGLVVGFSHVGTVDRSALSKYQSIDFLALMAANAGAIGWGSAWSGSGQNMAYKKEFFNQIGGFSPVSRRLSGDDIYLVQAISKIAPVGINLSPQSHVTTIPEDSIGRFLNQRIRWASNSSLAVGRKPFFFLFLLSAFVGNVFLLFSMISPELRIYFPIAFGTKFVCEALIIFAGSVRFGQSMHFLSYILWSVIQPVYIPTMGVLGLLGKFRWK